MRQTNKDLRRYYRVANRKYFGNALPELNLYFSKLRSISGVTRVLGDVPAYIEINEDLRTYQAITIQTVLHEMVHVEHPTWKGHDWRFDRRMLRLAKMGAMDGLW